MSTVETRPEPDENDDKAEQRHESHWAKVRENEEKLLKAREAHRRRIYGIDHSE